MKQQENEERTQTLTNPRLINNDYKTSSRDGSHPQKLFQPAYLIFNNKQVLKSENIFQASDTVGKQDFGNYLSNIAQDHIDSIESFNSKARQRLALVKIQQNLISQNHFQSINRMPASEDFKTSQQNQSLAENLLQKNYGQNNLESHYTDAQNDYSSDEQFEDRYLLAGANLYKEFITLTVEEKKLKIIQSNEVITSQQKIQEINSEKMQIQNSTINFLMPKFEQNLRTSQELFQHRQQIFNFSLKDSKEIRKLRILTPIKSLKKFILRKFGYSQGARNCQILNISFFNLYPNQSPLIVFPIQDQQNLQLIVLEFIKARRDLFIRFENDGSLRKKVERKAGKNQVQFDSDGQLQDSEQSQNQQLENQQEENQNHAKEIRQMIRVNKTQKSRYRGTKIVRCAFCHKTNKDIENIKICGPFYGPFLRGKIKTKHYTHLLCSLWCKKVYLNEDNELKEIAVQINRSQRKDCKYCGKNGAGLLCHGCNSSMHYQCGLGRCEYLWTSYELYCDKCHQKRQKQIQQELWQNQQQQNQLVEIQSSNQQKEDIKSDSQALKKNENLFQISQSHNIDVFDNLSLQEQHSRTQSILNMKNNQLKIQQQKLKIDMKNRIQINNESPQLEVLEEKCKPPKNKLPLFEVKIQEEQLSLKQKPKRCRRQKKRS